MNFPTSVFCIFLIFQIFMAGSCSKDKDTFGPESVQPEAPIIESRKESGEPDEQETEEQEEEQEGHSEEEEVEEEGSAEEQPQEETMPEGQQEEEQQEAPEQEGQQEPPPSGPTKSVEEITIFPQNHPLHDDVLGASVDDNSDAILEHIGLQTNIFADFGSGTYQGEPIGIPYVSVGSDQPKVPIVFRGNGTDGNYGHQSEKGPFPIPLDAPVEAAFVGDGHVISVDVDNGMLYELYNAQQVGNGWEASSAAVFNLNTVEFRPEGWTSADAAGLPIFPLLIRYSEVASGEIDHPIRFTLSRNKIYEGYIHPARHSIQGEVGNHLLPFGARLRLKDDFDISGFSQENQVILRALKKYGLILADVGVDMYLKGDPNENWNNADLRELKTIKVENFEVVEMGQIKTNQ
ncbi:hypothetical protein [Maribacter halichondriae]|uniref:hypothetical protein n=1 Tax=Maribacter halichondriae TaxID=2980554 RepID=UPI0023593D14|nr:hypothetical protein [Maribacter sp. Hal144]